MPVIGRIGAIAVMPIIDSVILCLMLAGAMLVLLEAGFRIGMRYKKTAGGEETGILDGAIFALLGLLLGFAFAGAVDRLNNRRDLVIEETNRIHAAYLRLELLAPEDQPPIRTLFRDYLDARLKAYRQVNSGHDPHLAFQASGELQKRIWSAAVIAVEKVDKQYAAEVVLPAINDMIDVTVAKKVAIASHLPFLILILLCTISLLSALVAGNGMAKSGLRHRLHGFIFSVSVSLTIYAILDLDNPRAGFIRLDAADRVLKELRDSI
jgi:hypothetical protein